MRLWLLVVVMAGCAAEAREPVATPGVEVAAAPRLDVSAVDQIDGEFAGHVAVGGKLRVRVPADPTLTATVHGPFAIAVRDDLLVITATDAGRGEIAIETIAGSARIALTAAPIASVAIVRDDHDSRYATIVLRDGAGKRLVDASLRVAPGSAPITFDRDAWDRVELATLSAADVVRVKTDLLAARDVAIEDACAWQDALAHATRHARSD